MKEVTHNFNWEQVIAALINEYSEDIEDGFWQLGVISQYIGLYHPDQVGEGVPSNLQRMTGVRLTKVNEWFPNTVYLEKGRIFYGSTGDTSRPEQSSPTAGEDSGPTGGDSAPSDSADRTLNRRRPRKLRSGR